MDWNCQQKKKISENPLKFIFIGRNCKLRSCSTSSLWMASFYEKAKLIKQKPVKMQLTICHLTERLCFTCLIKSSMLILYFHNFSWRLQMLVKQTSFVVIKNQSALCAIGINSKLSHKEILFFQHCDQNL